MLKAEHGISGVIKHISFNRFTLPLVFKILFVNPCAVDTQINRIGKYNQKNLEKRSYTKLCTWGYSPVVKIPRLTGNGLETIFVYPPF